jgi:hypothetical protein
MESKEKEMESKEEEMESNEEEMESETGFDSSTSKLHHITCIERNSVL